MLQQILIANVHYALEIQTTTNIVFMEWIPPLENAAIRIQQTVAKTINTIARIQSQVLD